ncbi:hypothetical protein PMAYCL1PPCAC_30928 [Pristionchus mayeri]|uniref:Uncharacterized protein n=1 Tax=Pristionchus mayeri TaxID=1317129 RepID=A0AAN5IC52_9BILA|nr:hypothetical protein PMAYCL1PPCAC_30928 [Pristionchus mayeri]
MIISRRTSERELRTIPMVAHSLFSNFPATKYILNMNRPVLGYPAFMILAERVIFSHSESSIGTSETLKDEISHIYNRDYSGENENTLLKLILILRRQQLKVIRNFGFCFFHVRFKFIDG